MDPLRVRPAKLHNPLEHQDSVRLLPARPHNAFGRVAGIGTQYVTQFMGHRIALEYGRLACAGARIKLPQAIAENVGLRVLGSHPGRAEDVQFQAGRGVLQDSQGNRFRIRRWRLRMDEPDRDADLLEELGDRVLGDSPH
jgi:hypothetical protein